MPNLDFDIVKAIIEFGVQFAPETTVDPGQNPVLRAAGTAMVTSYLSELHHLQIVKEPTPIFGTQGGLWIGYRLTDQGRELAKSDRALFKVLGKLLQNNRFEVSSAVANLIEENRKKISEAPYGDSFLVTLREISICFENGCFNAAIALCGKILEICLRRILMQNNLAFDNYSMAGGLLQQVNPYVPPNIIGSNFNNNSNIINVYRNAAIHVHEDAIPVPSRDEAILVIHAMRELVNSCLVNL